MRRALTPKPQSPSNATCDGSAGNIRKRRRKSASPDGLELAAALYGPTIRDRTGEIIEPEVEVRARLFAAPALSPSEIRRRQHEREIRQAARRLEAAVDAELRRRAEG